VTEIPVTQFEDASDGPERQAEIPDQAEPPKPVSEESVLPSRDSGTSDVPETGEATVDKVLASLRDLDDLPVDQHASVYSQAHDTLREALSGRADNAGEH
jgi:hypothetical protein